MAEILEIRMQSHEVRCHLCDCWTEHRWSVPVFNGDVVSNEFPDSLWESGGGGIAVCERCYERHERGEVATFDECYLWMLREFIAGAGI
jgi:hypothetical protein